MGHCIGFLLYAPISEIRGRAVILHLTNVAFAITAIVCAVSRTLSLFILALLALYTSIINAYCTILFATIGTVYENSYGFSVGQAGPAYFGLTVGFPIGQIVIAIFCAAVSRGHIYGFCG